MHSRAVVIVKQPEEIAVGDVDQTITIDQVTDRCLRNVYFRGQVLLNSVPVLLLKKCQHVALDAESHHHHPFFDMRLGNVNN